MCLNLLFLYFVLLPGKGWLTVGAQCIIIITPCNFSYVSLDREVLRFGTGIVFPGFIWFLNKDSFFEEANGYAI